jgi:Txe/YoeB family toxin of toxin-antitoxin system
MYSLVFHKKTKKQLPNIKSANLENNLKIILKILENNPYQNPPPYEKLENNLKDKYSRRINLKHRLVYQVLEKEQVVKILSIWTHYEF